MQYIAIKDAIVEQIDNGQLAARQKLPSERKLADAFSTTRVTLREALSLLEAEGRLYREDRRGWFISPHPLRIDPNEPLSFSALAKEQNRTPRTEVISATSPLASKKATSLLALPPFSEVYQIECVRYLEERPVCFVQNLVLPQATPGLIDHDLTQPLTELYQNQYQLRFTQSQYKIDTTSLLGDIAAHLRATAGTPAMVIERLYLNGEQRIEAVIEYWRHDAISIESQVKV